MKKKKVIFYIFDFVALMLSYVLCDYVSDKLNLIMVLMVGFVFYAIIYYFLCKLFKNVNVK